MARAIASGAMMSAPFAVTPCGSRVPSGTRTVSICSGTISRNSIQLMRSSSRVDGWRSGCGGRVRAGQHGECEREDDGDGRMSDAPGCPRVSKCSVIRSERLTLTRHISLDTVREAARHVYEAAARTPLVPLGPPGPTLAGGVPQARNAAADRLVQDPRRLQRRAAAAAPRSSPTASGPSAPATPRRASRWPRARSARAAA